MEPLLLVLLAVTMSIIFLITLLIYDFDIMAPASLMTGTMAFSCVMAVTQLHNWILSMSFVGYAGLVLGILVFIIASVWCSKQSQLPVIQMPLPDIEVRNFVFFLAMMLMVILAFFSIKEIYQISVSLGNDKGIFNTLRVLRPAIEAKQIELSRWMSYRMFIAQAITYVYTYIFINRTISHGLSIYNVIYMIPGILYIPFLIATTGRMDMLMYVIYFVVVAMLLYHKIKGYDINVNKKVIFVLLIAGIAFFTFFLLMGNFTGKTITEDRTPLVILAHYAGLSIPAFGVAVNTPILNSGYIGSNTLIGIYRGLSHISMQFPRVDLFLPFVQFSGIDTNVYTAEWRYILDYGFIGMMTIMSILGLGYTFCYEYVKRHNVSPVIIMFYAMMAYPLFLSSIDERFMLGMIGTTPIYNFILLYVTFKLAVKRK